MSTGDIWQHKKGGVYTEVERRVCRSDMTEGQFVLPESGHLFNVWAYLTDDIRAGEEVVIYAPQRPGAWSLFARPARMVDDGRFTRLAPAHADRDEFPESKFDVAGGEA